jgi:diaminopimelate epimerase
MHGIGNDFVVVDAIQNPLLPVDLSELSRKINDRRLGVGSDGLVILEEGTVAPFRMRMFNPDGSESEMCGNAIRCIHQLIKSHGHTSEDSFQVETGSGTLTLSKTKLGLISVDMGTPRLNRVDIPMTGEPGETFLDKPIGGFLGTAVSMGNPHLVIFVENVEAIDLPRQGSSLETNSLFPNRTNVHFVQVIDRQHMIQRTWERGAGATLACGTGACAVAVAGFETGRTDREVDIKLPGGHLEIHYSESGRVTMSGPADTVFEGEFPESL